MEHWVETQGRHLCRMRSRADILQRVLQASHTAGLSAEEEGFLEAALTYESSQESQTLAACKKLLQSGAAVKKLQLSLESLEQSSAPIDKEGILHVALEQSVDEILSHLHGSTSATEVEEEMINLDHLIRSGPFGPRLARM